MKSTKSWARRLTFLLALGLSLASSSLPVLAFDEEVGLTTTTTTTVTTSSNLHQEPTPVTVTEPTLVSPPSVTNVGEDPNTSQNGTSQSSNPNQNPTTATEIPLTSQSTTATTAQTTEDEENKQKEAEVSKPLYRLYHPGLKVHLYTLDKKEYDILAGRGWKQEGLAWEVETSGRYDKVYRLYHPGLKVHLYTKDRNEYTLLGQRGWKQEGTAFYSYGSVPIYRLYHKGLKRHLYTKDANEYRILAGRGWRQEGVAFYGIGKGSSVVTPPSTSPAPKQLSLKEIKANFTGKGLEIQLKSENISDFSIVKLAVWSEKDGQDDLKWYTASKDGILTIPYSSLSGFGNYQIHAYNSQNKQLTGLATTTAKLSKPALTTKITKETTVRYRIDITEVPSYFTELKVPVWSDQGGQDDIKWYTAKKVATGHYQVTVNLADHKFTSGNYQAHLYGKTSFQKSQTSFGMTAGFTVGDLGKPQAKISIQNVNQTKGSFDVLISDLVVPGGFTKVLVPVWSEQGGQDDIRWYTATKQANGTYKITVSAANHKYNSGKYQVHAYVELGTKKTFLGSQTTSLQLPSHTGKITLSPVNAANYTFTVSISDVAALAGIKQVRVAVWSEAEGQNDLRWYTTYKNGQQYTNIVRLANHYFSNGKYQVHVYYDLKNGKTVGLGSKTINVTTPAPRDYVQQELRNLVNQFHSIFAGVGGQKSLYIAATDGIDTVLYNDSVQRSASTIKLFIMAAAFSKASRGELNLAAHYTVRSSDIVQASVNLGNAAGQTYSLDTINRFMVETSDNTATNIMIRHIGGIEAVNQEIRRLGYTKTYLERYMHDPVAINAGKDNYISAQEAGDLIRNMYNRTLVSRQSDNKMVSNLSNNYYPLWLPSAIRGQAYVIDKPGNHGGFGVENDVAVISKNGRSYAVAVLTQGTGSNGLSLTSRFGQFGQAIVNQLNR